MSDYERSTTVEAEADALFDYLSDVGNLPRYFSRMTEAEPAGGEAVHVTPPTVHRMTAIEDCDIFEVSTPELDDVVRLEDRYGRVEP